MTCPRCGSEDIFPVCVVDSYMELVRLKLVCGVCDHKWFDIWEYLEDGVENGLL